MTNINEKVYDAITNIFENWGQDNGKAADGFVGWTWDQREETLKELREGDLDSLVGEVEYTLNQTDEYRTTDAKSEARQWIKDHAEELVEAIEESLED